MSDKLSWEAFQELTANRKAKGFTVVQIVAGLVPSNKEQAPIDPGFHNEGGASPQPVKRRPVGMPKIAFIQTHTQHAVLEQEIRSLIRSNLHPAFVPIQVWIVSMRPQRACNKVISCCGGVLKRCRSANKT